MFPETRTRSSILESHTNEGMALNWMTRRRHGGLAKKCHRGRVYGWKYAALGPGI
jgi:hypothetical protein